MRAYICIEGVFCKIYVVFYYKLQIHYFLVLLLSLASDSGLIVNTCGWIDGMGYELLVHVITAFEADMVLVIDNDR